MQRLRLLRPTWHLNEEHLDSDPITQDGIIGPEMSDTE
jgi:hypothetical protein